MFRGILAALGLANFGLGLLSASQPELVAGWIGFEDAGTRLGVPRHPLNI